MDLLYVIGPDRTGSGNRDLRWSLRSVARHATGVSRVLVAGYPPDWLAEEVVRLPVPNVWPKGKLRNQGVALLAAIDAGELRGEFAWTDDDVILSAPLDLDALPFFCRGKAIPRPERMESRGAYAEFLTNTRNTLVSEGYPAVDAVGHALRRLRADEAPEVRRLFELAGPLGIEMQAAFQNVRARRERVDFTFRKDWKLRSFDADAVRSGMFSLSDDALKDARMRDWLKAELGEPCRYEKEDAA
jgi:hypothetical protein